MVRGRMGGVGRPFNLGEKTVVRCVVRLGDGTTGVAYITGRDTRKAELAAFSDALLLSGHLAPASLDPARAALAARRQQRAAAVASTQVDFFTMVRGDD